MATIHDPADLFPADLTTNILTRGLRGVIPGWKPGLPDGGRHLFGFRIYKDDMTPVVFHHRLGVTADLVIGVEHRPAGTFHSYDKNTDFFAQRLTVQALGDDFTTVYELAAGSPDGVSIERHAYYDRHPVSGQPYLQREILKITGAAIAIHADRLAALAAMADAL